MRVSSFALCALLATPAAADELSVASIFGSHMVVQENEPIPIWGWSAPGSEVQVSWDSQAKRTKASPEGRWRIQLPAQASGSDPFEAHLIEIVSGEETLQLNDVLLGEVWLASGQSNMEWPLGASNSFETAKAKAPLLGLRMFTAERVSVTQPMEDVNGTWQTYSAESCSAFSAVGAYFGIDLLAALKRPIGILHTSWGGSRVEAWMSEQALAAFPKSMLQLEQSRAVEASAGLERHAHAKAKLSAEELEGWQACDLPIDFEELAPGFDGSIWFRRELRLPEGWEQKTFSLSIGVIDDDEETWLAGIELGATRGWQEHRQYPVTGAAREALLAGSASICVRAIDTGGWGGFSSAADQIALVASDGERHPLASGWTWKAGEATHRMAPNHAPAQLYNGMLAPFEGLRFAGCIWYQGESNAGDPAGYARLFPAMIQDWRRRLKQADLPFYFVQLANYEAGESVDWPGLREAQRLTLERVEHTGMAVIIDIGNPIDIHPRNKQDVGSRLARQALNKTYGHDVIPSGPMALEASSEGSICLVKFDCFGSKLAIRDGQPKVLGLELAGPDGVFHEATGSVQGTALKVQSELVANPKRVRYAWSNDPSTSNLIQGDQLPASPFVLPVGPR